jgi:hypothetical protein
MTVKILNGNGLLYGVGSPPSCDTKVTSPVSPFCCVFQRYVCVWIEAAPFLDISASFLCPFSKLNPELFILKKKENPYLCPEFVPELNLAPLLTRFDGFCLAHLDILIFRRILTPSLFCILVKFDTATLSTREAIRGCESLSVRSASDIRVGVTANVGVRLLDEHLARLFIHFEVIGVLSVFVPTATFGTYKGTLVNSLTSSRNRVWCSHS